MASFCLFCHLNLVIAIQLGALAITVANPTDLVKVRLQSEGKLPPGVPRRYLGALDAYFKIIRQVYISQLTDQKFKVDHTSSECPILQFRKE